MKSKKQKESHDKLCITIVKCFTRMQNAKEEEQKPNIKRKWRNETKKTNAKPKIKQNKTKNQMANKTIFIV